MNLFSINIGGKLFHFDGPKVMGILNVTPDSFYEASRVNSESAAVAKAAQMVAQGADFIDVGGYSSRPGADDISQQEELDRVIPVIGKISQALPAAIISIDTFRSTVAREAINAGAHLINDISGGDGDDRMFETVKDLGVPYIAMHMIGTPQNMQKNPTYENVTLDVFKSLSEKLSRLRLLGVKDVMLDPGFGFGKTVEHNYKLLKDLEHFKALECPILVGFSRKSMIYKALNISPQDALNGTSVLNTIATQKGALLLRVHDVKEAKEVCDLYSLMNRS